MSWVDVIEAVLRHAGDGAQLLAHAHRRGASGIDAHTITLRYAGEDAVGAGEAFLRTFSDRDLAPAGQVAVEASVEWEHHSEPAPRLDLQIAIGLCAPTKEPA